VEDRAETAKFWPPLYEELIPPDRAGEVLHTTNTRMTNPGVWARRTQEKEEAIRSQGSEKMEATKGVFTSGIVFDARRDRGSHSVPFTGRQARGKNLAAGAGPRAVGPWPPIQMLYALARAISPSRTGHLSQLHRTWTASVCGKWRTIPEDVATCWKHWATVYKNDAPVWGGELRRREVSASTKPAAAHLMEKLAS